MGDSSCFWLEYGRQLPDVCLFLRVCDGWEAVVGNPESFFTLPNHLSLRLVPEPSHPFFCSPPCNWARRWLFQEACWLLLLQRLCWSLGNECVYWHSFPGGSDSKESTCSAGGLGSIPGLERSPGVGSGSPLQYSCLENPVDRGAWRAIVHKVAKSQI